MNFYFTQFNNPFGTGIIASLENKICWLSFKNKEQELKKLINSYIQEADSSISSALSNKDFSFVQNKSHFNNVLMLMEAYFQGEKINFNTVETVYLKGTPFQRKVWDNLKEIKYGTVKSYKEIANLTGNKGASRAIGSANAKNPIPLIVPCHRVIKSDGSIGGFSAGIDIKKALLHLENIEL